MADIAQLEYGLGTSFAEKYQKALSTKKIKRFDLSNESKVALVDAIKVNMDVDTQHLQFLWDGDTYDVAIVETLREIRPKQAKYSIMTSVMFNKKWLTLFLSEDDFKKLVPNNLYVIVGKLTKKEYKGKENLSFGVHVLASMPEIAEWSSAVPSTGIKVTQL